MLSAILSACETAAYSIGEPRIRTLLEEGFKGAERLVQDAEQIGYANGERLFGKRP